MDKPLALVLSDLHLGEESSVLHYAGTEQQGQQPFVKALAQRIRDAVPGLHGTIPFLILAGDTLDYSLAPADEAILDFRLFLKDVHSLFGTIIYIPGNHDHHVWRTLQEEVHVVNRIRDREPVRQFPHEQIGTISAAGEAQLSLNGVAADGLGAKTFLKTLLPQDAGDKDFAVVYPNLYIKFAEPGADTLITHGHFFEVAWTATSDALTRSLDLSTINYRILEMINSPLTEFGWYGLGQAGQLSELIEELYKGVRHSDYRTLDLVVEDLRDYLDELWAHEPERKAGFLSGIKSLAAEFEAQGRETASDKALDLAAHLVRWGVKKLVRKREAPTPGSSLRHSQTILDDPSTCARIKRYLSYSSGRPYEFRPAQVIFGHTHVPIADGRIETTSNGNPYTIRAYNTGGWVVDSENAAEVIASRPVPMLISRAGAVEGINFPWPSDARILEGMPTARIIETLGRNI